MKKWKTFVAAGVVIFGISAPTVYYIVNRPFDDAAYIKLVESYLAKSNADENLKGQLREVVRIMKSTPGFSAENQAFNMYDMCPLVLKQLRRQIENENNGIDNEPQMESGDGQHFTVREWLAKDSASIIKYCTYAGRREAEAWQAKDKKGQDEKVARVAAAAALNDELKNLERAADEAGMLRNSKNVIPKVGLSCPPGYVTEGDYCQQR